MGAVGQTDITKHIVTFCSFVNTHNSLWYFGLYTVSNLVGWVKINRSTL